MLERNLILWRGWLVACWPWSLQFVVDFHLHTANQSVIMISCGEMPLEGLALPPYTIQSLAMEHGSLKNGWCGRKSVSSPLGNSLDACDLVLYPYEVIMLNLEVWMSFPLRSIACYLYCVERRDDLICLESILVGCLNLNLPSDCWIILELKCCSYTCCLAIMEDCSHFPEAV